jgi:hypothetical protein
MLPRTLEREVTILRHVPNSFELLAEMWRLTVKRSEIFVQDVARPRSSREIDSVVRKHAGGATGGDAGAETMTSARHWTLAHVTT